MPGILVTENGGQKESNDSCADGQLQGLEQSMKEKVTTSSKGSQTNTESNTKISEVKGDQTKEAEDCVNDKELPRSDSPTDSGTIYVIIIYLYLWLPW